MRQISPGLIQRPDGIALCHRAVTEPRQLRKHEPHPVTSLLAHAELLLHPLDDRCLSCHEPAETEAIGHCLPRNLIQNSDRLIRQNQISRREIFPQMRNRGGAGNEQDIGCAPQ